MTSSVLRLSLAPLSLIVLILAGCGASSSSAPATSAPATLAPTSAGPGTAAPVPTPRPAASPVITGGRIAATVNGRPVPMSTFTVLFNLAYHRSAGQPGFNATTLTDQVMREVVEFELVRQYAVAHHIAVSPAQVNASVRHEQQIQGGAAQFNRRLAQVGLTLQSYRTLLEPTLLAQKVQNVVAPVNLKPAPAAQVRHILVMFHPQGKKARTNAQAKARAEQILQQLRKGASFAALARQDSDDPGSAAKGGNLGTVFPHQMVPEFDKATFTLPLHTPTMIRTMYGYHIVDVLWRGTARRSAQDQQAQQQQQFSIWLNNQVQHAKVVRLARVHIPAS